MDEEFNMEDVKGFSFAREVYDWVESGIAALICMIILFTFMGRMVGVVGDSMLPTLHDSDRLIISRLFYKPQYGDIVVVTKPDDSGLHQPLIKRVIATEGQTIDIIGAQGIVLLDGNILDEPYILELTLAMGDMEYPATVPEGHVFVMGDNRNNSKDSRTSEVGMVDERYLLGKVYYRALPFEDMGSPYNLSDND